MNWNWNLKKENEEIPLCTNRYINSLHRPRRCYDAVLSTGPPFNKCETYVIHEKYQVLHWFRAGSCTGTPGHVLHAWMGHVIHDIPMYYMAYPCNT